MTQPPVQSEVPDRSFDDWDSVNSWMEEQWLGPLKTTVENAIGEDENWFNSLTSGLMDGANDLVSWGTSWIPFKDMIFPDVTMPDGSTRQIRSVSQDSATGYEMARQYKDLAREAYQRLEARWTSDYKPHSASPLTLHKAGQKFTTVAEEIQGVSGEVQQVQTIAGWQGDGAEAYQRIVPHQVDAASGVSDIVGNGGNVLYNAADGLRMFYLSVAATFSQGKTVIENFDPKGLDANLNFLFDSAPRARQATAVLEDAERFLVEQLEEAETNWAGAVNRAEGILTDNSTLDTDVFVNGGWPASEADKLPEMEPGGGGGAQQAFPQPEMPAPESGMPNENIPAPEQNVAPANPETSGNTEQDQWTTF